MKNIEIENLRQLARCWNNLDSSPITSIITEDLTFESQWVLIPVIGKTYFLEYLNAKFNAIKAYKKIEPISVIAELGVIPELDSKPCIVLTQIVSDEIRQVTILITLTAELIGKIRVCFIPDPKDAIKTGEFPN